MTWVGGAVRVGELADHHLPRMTAVVGPLPLVRSSGHLESPEFDHHEKLLDRRKALISGTGLALGLAAADSAALATPMLSSPQSELMPRGKQRRVVVIGEIGRAHV